MNEGVEAKSPHKRKRLEDQHTGKALKTPKRRRQHPERNEQPATNDPETATKTVGIDGKDSGILIATNGHVVSGLDLETGASNKLLLRDGGTTATWSVSAPMGGRMVDIDPIFSPDEKYVFCARYVVRLDLADRRRYLLITYHDSLQVYSTADSLLVRRISLPLKAAGRQHNQHAYIAAVSSSQASPDLVWVGCSDGRVWRLNWTTGSIEELKTRDGNQLTDIKAEIITIAGAPQEVLFASERLDKRSEVVAYDTARLSDPDIRRLYTHTSQIQKLLSISGGRALVAVSGNTVLVGDLKPREIGAVGELKYRFSSFDLSDEISALDARVSPRKQSKKKDSANAKNSPPLVDLAIGCARGAILVYGDILSGIRAIGETGSQQILPRKHHWHRKAVSSVKWSRDGTADSHTSLRDTNGSKVTTSYPVDQKPSSSYGRRIRASGTFSHISAQASRTLPSLPVVLPTPSTWTITRQWCFPLRK